MRYNEAQLKCIQKNLIRASEGLKKNTNGFESMLFASEFFIWISHATLAGYKIEKDTGKMYTQEGNVRTYLDVS